MLSKRNIRKNTLELLFGYEYNKDIKTDDYFNLSYDNFNCQDDENNSVKNLFLSVENNVDNLDCIIEKYLKEWKISRLSLITLSILRLSTYEMLYEKLAPAISINEAVELSKKYGETGSSSYVNGVLNNIAKGEIQ